MDRYLNQHYKYYVREMRIIAYNQLLESYSYFHTDQQSEIDHGLELPYPTMRVEKKKCFPYALTNYFR